MLATRSRSHVSIITVVAATMATPLSITIGQYTDRGQKLINQDFHGVVVPPPPLLQMKGIALAIADGISSSDVSQIASEVAVKSFLDDYFATSEAWSVKRSVLRVLQATNSWLYAQTRNGPYRYQMDRGYVTTFSALILKSTTAHLFHLGDTAIYRLQGTQLELLTEPHRVWLSNQESYLSRALGMRDWLDIDYQSLSIEVGDIFLMMSDGVYESIVADQLITILQASTDDLDRAAYTIGQAAFDQGSDDNLTIQIVRIDTLPEPQIGELNHQFERLPFPPELRPRMVFDGFDILRELHHSSRSHLYLAREREHEQEVVLKVPAIDQRDNADYLERFLLEEWVARRLNNAHLLKSCAPPHGRQYVYTIKEYIDGRTLMQWMRDHPTPDLDQVRDIVSQIARGLQALHRQEILHQDLRPHNIMIDQSSTVKIIDFGSVRIAGIAEIARPDAEEAILGTVQYTAPEYFLGATGTPRSDLFSLAVITYQMLCGALPYGNQVAQTHSRTAQYRLRYQPLLTHRQGIPYWIDRCLRTALQPNPRQRYGEISEFIHDLHHPNPTYLAQDRLPLLERNPLRFWQGVSITLVLILLALLLTHPNFTPVNLEMTNEQNRND